MAKDSYKKIAYQLIEIEEEFKMTKGFELSVVLETYATDESYFCGGFEDPDLAAHFVVTYNRGIVLFGIPIKEIFEPIENRYYIDAIRSDVIEARESAINKVPRQYKNVVQECLRGYVNDFNNQELDHNILISFSEYMLEEIEIALA